ncbi:MAG: ATP-binding cassette domain-containing protein [SAR324 cluster bacterium]|nr:ATP-binding cassette domain-containing protein [SAR324 cluster bacterium]
MNNTNCLLCLSGIHFDIGSNNVTLHCHCEIPHGRLIGVLGPNGCGKSSLFKALVGEIPYSGEISYFGKSFADVREQVGYLPQHIEIPFDFPISVEEFIAVGSPHYFKFKWPWQKRNDSEKVRDIMAKLAIEHLARAQLSELSGGEQRRVYLGRLLMQDSKLFFLDEPLAGVDEQGEELIVKIWRELVDQGKTVLVVHHDLETVKEIFDEVLVFKHNHIEHFSVDKGSLGSPYKELLTA